MHAVLRCARQCKAVIWPCRHVHKQLIQIHVTNLVLAGHRYDLAVKVVNVSLAKIRAHSLAAFNWRDGDQNWARATVNQVLDDDLVVIRNFT